MDIEIAPKLTFSQAELILIERARQALSKMDYSISGRWRTMTVSALIYMNPLRIDFKAHTPGQIGQAFIGPEVPLVENLFEGDTFTSDFGKIIDDAVKQFQDYMNKPDEPHKE